MPRMIFPAACPQCGEVRKFIEFKAEACTPGPDSPPSEYGFRCMACKLIVPTIEDAQGTAHAWKEGQHLETTTS